MSKIRAIFYDKSLLKRNMKKVISIFLIILILSSLLLFFLEIKSRAASTTYKGIADFDNKYPGVRELIEDLQKDHPNWEFEILETGLEWPEVLKGEHRKNVTHKHDGIWNCQEPDCKDKQHEPGWYYASEATIAYYMDPRNSLCDDYIFQFEKLSYNAPTNEAELNDIKDGVASIISDCDYLQGTITYYDANGNKKSINKTYVDVIMEAAKESKVSPYHIASRIRQEQGVGSAGSMIKGTWSGYKGLYNYFNWGAYGGTTTEIINAGLAMAKRKGWTDPEKSIKGGAQSLANEYINCGQDCLYLQKFDVVDGGDGYYTFQYMTNVAASKSEAEEIREAYRYLGLLSKDSKMTFRVPVYKKMPKEKAPAPGTEKIVTQDVQINENGVNIRDGKSTNNKVIATLNKGTKLVRIEYDTKKASDGNYWDKVVLSNGNKGYVVRTYLTQISLQSNCSDKYIVVDHTNFRNGPGTSGTTVIKLLVPGQILTVVEKGKYPSLNGESWYRVKLSDGSYGYIGTGYTPETPTIEVYDEASMTYDRVKVVCSDGLNIRKTPDASANNVLKTLPQGTTLTRIQKGAADSDGYIWDKVTTSGGTTGYAVRQQKSTGKVWIEPVKYNGNSTAISGSGFKTEGSNFIAQPNIKVGDIKKSASDAVVKKGNTVIADKDSIGTGYTVSSGGKSYTIIVLGDVNGDGKVNTGDTLAMSQHIEEYKKMTNNNYLRAADTNRDGKVNTGDSLVLRQHVEDFKKLTF